MRVGGAGSGVSTHLAGMSSLWHDADWQPEKTLDIPRVVQRFPDEQDLLPSEAHQLPGGVDAFAKLDEIYEAAGAQMERGIEGSAFLHGRRPTTTPDVRAMPGLSDEGRPEINDATRTMVARSSDPDRKSFDVRAAQDTRHVDDQIVKAAVAGNQPRQVSNATDPASDARKDAARAVKTLEMAEGIGITMAAVAAGQAIDPAAGSIAAEAAAVVKAVSTSKTAVGMTNAMEDMPETSRAAELRRGLARRAATEASEAGFTAVEGVPPRHQPSLDPGGLDPDAMGHQPSLDPGDDPTGGR